MMNKVQKIRNEVERLQNELIQEREKGYGSDVDDACILELQNVLTYIDSLQEEPVSRRFTFKAIPRLLEMIEPTDRAKSYIAKLADTLEVEGYSTDAKIVRESLKIMNGEKVAMATMDEEPVSEDLEKAASRYAKEEYNHKNHTTLPDRCRGCYAPLTYAFKAGAKWQKEQMIANATEAIVHTDAGGYPYISQIEFYDYEKDVPLAKEGERYKVILIKKN